jgi:hypothetical protein
VVLCVTSPGRDGVLVGVYEDPGVAATDMDNIRAEHGYATRVDDTGRTWVFVIAEGSDSEPLAPLQRFGFELSSRHAKGCRKQVRRCAATSSQGD